MNEDIQLLTTENEEDTETISGNSPESPVDGTGDAETGTGSPETPPEDSETPGGAGPDVPGGTETAVVHEEDSDAVVGADAPGSDNAEVLEALETVSAKLDDNSDVETLAESVRSLVDVMSVQAAALAEEEAPGIPISGYADYSYPIQVEYGIFPTSQGSETGYSESYDTAEDFENGYTYMKESVDNGSLAWFSIRSVTDSSGTVVYDSTVTEEETAQEQSPEEETPDTFREDVLASLAAVNENLQSVSMNDLEYRQETLLLQQQYIELEKESRELHYHMLACNIAIGFSILLTLGYMVAHGFFQRMKVG